MPSAAVRRAWTERGFAHLAAAVDNGDGTFTEFIGSVPTDDAWQAMTTAQRKAALVAAVKAVRDAQSAAPTALAITGTVTV